MPVSSTVLYSSKSSANYAQINDLIGQFFAFFQSLGAASSITLVSDNNPADTVRRTIVFKIREAAENVTLSANTTTQITYTTRGASYQVLLQNYILKVMHAENTFLYNIAVVGSATFFMGIVKLSTGKYVWWSGGSGYYDVTPYSQVTISPAYYQDPSPDGKIILLPRYARMGGVLIGTFLSVMVLGYSGTNYPTLTTDSIYTDGTNYYVSWQGSTNYLYVIKDI